MLKLPLQFYDESGRILPPKWLYALSLMLCIDWIAFIFSLASRSQTSELLSFFYPNKASLGTALVASLPILMGLVLVSQRERLWKKGFVKWRRVVRPSIQLGCLLLLAVQFTYLIDHQWGFEFFVALRMVFCVFAFYAVWRSRHLRWMVEDWAVVDSSVSDKK
ncbi:DUF2919 family protein [Alteromonas gracilis]|uniref:DUF2919 family protein n=1 Tax=Alteromonas gracilis TaxID=1479524 RepID=UPI00373546F9